MREWRASGVPVPRPRVPVVTVADWLAAGQARLGLELVAGAAGMQRRIGEAAIHRPGLALTGFFRHFPPRRIQLLGLAEMSYLASLAGGARADRLRRLFAQRIPCVVVSRRQKIPPELVRLGEAFRTPVLRTPLVTKHFVNAATLVMERLMAPQVLVQGTMVDILGIGVLLEGPPGVGKSETALDLIVKGHRLVADDVTMLRRDSAGVIIGMPAGVTRYHLEIRGLGIIHVPSLFGVASVLAEKRLDLIASLCPLPAAAGDRSGQGSGKRTVLGMEIPTIAIPVAPGRDVANIVEAAALDQQLKRLGHDAAKELDEKLIAVLAGGRRRA